MCTSINIKLKLRLEWKRRRTIANAIFGAERESERKQTNKQTQISLIKKYIYRERKKKVFQSENKNEWKPIVEKKKEFSRCLLFEIIKSL